MKLAKNYDLVIINKENEVCKGLWSRVQGQERSILDYVLTNSKLLPTVTEMRTNSMVCLNQRKVEKHETQTTM